METNNLIKESVYGLTILKPLQKIRFQIRLPENVCAITGFGTTSNKLSEGYVPEYGEVYKGDTVGLLTLSLPGKGDVIFGEDVKVDDNDYADFFEKTLPSNYVPYVYAKKRNIYLDTFVKITNPLLEGYYQDVYNPFVTIGEDGLYHYLYKVRLYIRYQVFPDTQNT